MIEDSADQYDTHIELSFVEIYNEKIIDLLNADHPNGPSLGLSLRENEKDRVTIANVTLARPKSVDEVMTLVQLGNERRSTSSTASNSVSSRSHSVLQLKIGRSDKGHQVDTDQGVVSRDSASATLSIIDLAGSERAAATQNMGQRMVEGANINKSLLALNNCITALCSNSSSGSGNHVPFRNSKLTRMLKFSLGGNCRTVMVVCVSPSSKDIEETHNTLQWANRAKDMKMQVTRNTAGQTVNTAQYVRTIAEQQVTISNLKAELEEAQASDSSHVSKKRKQALDAFELNLEGVREEKISAAKDIENGAEIRAKWDAAMLKIATFQRRIQVIDSGSASDSSETLNQEKVHLQTLIRKLESSFPLNPTVEATARKEAVRVRTIEEGLGEIDDRRKREKLDGPVGSYAESAVALERERLSNAIAEARIRGYRQTLSVEAEAATQQQSAFCRVIAALLAEDGLLDRIAGSLGSSDFMAMRGRLRNVIHQAQSALNPVSLAMSQRELPEPPRASATPLRNSASSRSSSSRRPASQLHDTSSLIEPSSTLRQSALRRFQNHSISMGSPVRAEHVASPRKRPLRPYAAGLAAQAQKSKLAMARSPHASSSARVPAPEEKKKLAWRDGNGGDLADYKNISVVMSSSPEIETSREEGCSGHEEWSEVESDDNILPPITTLALPQSAPSISFPTVLPITSSATAPSSSSVSSSFTMVGSSAEEPAWKLARKREGKMSALDSVLETAEVASPDQRRAPMGPPSRTFNHSSNTSTSYNASYPSSSSLHRPTASSANRQVSADFAVPSGPLVDNISKPSIMTSRLSSSNREALSSTSTAARRSSNIGPQRTPNLHKVRISSGPRVSMLPQSQTGNISITSHNVSSGNTSTSVSALAGGAKRGPRDSMIPAGRRQSTLPSGVGVGMGGVRRQPRGSMLPGDTSMLSVAGGGGGLPRAPVFATGGSGSGSGAGRSSASRSSILPWRG